jgi:dihydropteroate synthase type 2
MSNRPQILGIVNITSDSFSDGGKYLTPAAAIEHAEKLIAGGADIIDLGPAASNPDAAAVSPELEISRLQAVIPALQDKGARISLDSFQPQTQLFGISKNVEFLNDIQGFPEASIYPQLAGARCKLIVMHSVQQCGKATRVEISAAQALERIFRFFERRVKELVEAGIARDRLILDPGMGFFLSSLPEASFRVLANLNELKRAFGLPIHVCVSRKSFLRPLAGQDKSHLGAASLAAEILTAINGADYIRTHEPAALATALRVMEKISID